MLWPQTKPYLRRGQARLLAFWHACFSIVLALSQLCSAQDMPISSGIRRASRCLWLHSLRMEGREQADREGKCPRRFPATTRLKVVKGDL